MFGCIVLHFRDDDFKSRALIQFSLIAEQSSMLFHDSRGDCQTQPGAAFLSGKEGIKQARLDFGRNAFAGILDHQNNSWSCAAVHLG
jgi:hypothetical protein